MSKLRKYFDEAERRYTYRVKSIVALEDQQLDAIERAMAKYNPFDMSQVGKTIMHRNPLDFPNVNAAEVYSVDITLGLPASPAVLSREFATAISCHPGEIVVRGENDPTEIETQRLNAEADMTAEGGDNEPATLLDTALEQPEGVAADGAKYYGSAYNGRLVQKMKEIANERKTTVQQSHDYTPAKSDVPADPGFELPVGDNIETSKHGNLDDNTKTYRRVYRNGKVVSRDGIATGRSKK